MLIGYIKLSQDGIEPLKEYNPPVKDKNTSHWYFDDFRISLQYFFNKKERTSGIGILAFAPNGNIWLQTGLYCENYNELITYYCGIDIALDEAEKSKAKNIEIFIPNNKIISILQNNSLKGEIYTCLNSHFREKLTKFNKIIFTFRENYLDEVKQRLNKEAIEASKPPVISLHGQWTNNINVCYFNIQMTEEEKQCFAKQYANLFLDFMEQYIKEYEEDYGKEALQKFYKDANEGKIKELPLTKRNLREKRESIPIKVKTLPFKKNILCQNCNSDMIFESCTLEKPENEKYFLMRCQKCFATKTLNEKGRLLHYGKYPKKK